LHQNTKLAGSIASSLDATDPLFSEANAASRRHSPPRKVSGKGKKAAAACADSNTKQPQDDAASPKHALLLKTACGIMRDIKQQQDTLQSNIDRGDVADPAHSRRVLRQCRRDRDAAQQSTKSMYTSYAELQNTTQRLQMLSQTLQNEIDADRSYRLGRQDRQDGDSTNTNSGEQHQRVLNRLKNYSSTQ